MKNQSRWQKNKIVRRKYCGEKKISYFYPKWQNSEFMMNANEEQKYITASRSKENIHKKAIGVECRWVKEIEWAEATTTTRNWAGNENDCCLNILCIDINVHHMNILFLFRKSYSQSVNIAVETWHSHLNTITHFDWLRTHGAWMEWKFNRRLVHGQMKNDRSVLCKHARSDVKMGKSKRGKERKRKITYKMEAKTIEPNCFVWLEHLLKLPIISYARRLFQAISIWMVKSTKTSTATI